MGGGAWLFDEGTFALTPLSLCAFTNAEATDVGNAPIASDDCVAYSFWDTLLSSPSSSLSSSASWALPPYWRCPVRCSTYTSRDQRMMLLVISFRHQLGVLPRVDATHEMVVIVMPRA